MTDTHQSNLAQKYLMPDQPRISTKQYGLNAKIRKLKMLASLKIIRKAQMIDDAGRFIPFYEYISYPKPQFLNLFLPFFQNIN